MLGQVEAGGRVEDGPSSKGARLSGLHQAMPRADGRVSLLDMYVTLQTRKRQ